MQIRLAVIGLGNVGRRFLELVQRKHDLIKNRFDLDLIVTAAGDTTGGARSRQIAVAKIIRRITRQAYAVET